MNRISCTWLALLALSFSTTGALAVSYTFTNIADSTTPAPVGTFTEFSSPSISGSTVAFAGSYVGGHGIFTGSGGPLTTIAKRGDAAQSVTLFRVSDPAISGNAVAFLGVYGDPGSGIFFGSGGPITTIAKIGDSAPEGTLSGFGDPAISGTTVAFRAVISRDGIGIFTGSGGPLTTIAKTGDPAPLGAFYQVGDPSISANSVAFLGRYSDFTDTFAGIFVGSGGPLTKVVTTGDPAPIGTFNYINEPSISGDTIAFRGDDDGDGFIFAIGQDATVTSMARGGDAAFANSAFLIVAPPAVGGKDVAILVYYPEVDSELVREGIFTGDGGPLNKVITTGDTLFGSTLVSLFYERSGFKSDSFGFDAYGSGNIAFRYLLADGRQGVAMASPVPEPATGVSATVCLLFACVHRLGCDRRSK